MRKIKFRVWEKVACVMEYPFDLFSARNASMCVENTMYDYDVMQFTGLKDRAGKEIYENDIVEWEDGSTHQIMWSDISTPHWSGCSDGHLADKKDERRCKVVGNIYENSNLL